MEIEIICNTCKEKFTTDNPKENNCELCDSKFDFPKNEKELQEFDEKYKDFDFKCDHEKIDPQKIIKSSKL